MQRPPSGGPRRTCSSTLTGWSGPTTTSIRIRRTRRRRCRSEHRDTGAPRSPGRSPSLTSSRSPRRSRATGLRGGSPVLCSWGVTRTRSRLRHSRTAVEVLVANGVEVAVDSEDAYTPTPAISHAILTHNARGGAHGGRDRDHAISQPAGGRRLQVQPSARRPGRHRRHAGDSGRGERVTASRAERRRSACHSSRRSSVRADTTFGPPTSAT